MIPGAHVPFSEPAERGVVCAFLLDSRYTGSQCAEQAITAQHFFRPHFATLFGVLMDAWANNRPMDTVTLIQKLHDLSLLEQVGGGAEVATLFNFLPTLANLKEHLRILRDQKLLRDTLALCRSTEARVAALDFPDAQTLATDFSTTAAGLVGTQVRGYVPMKRRVLDKIDRMQSQEPDENFVLTGIGKLDRFSPMRRGDMPVITGAHKSGKSMLAISIARNVLMRGGAVMYASLEQPAEEQMDRLLHGYARLPTRKDHQSKLSEFDMAKVMKMTEAAEWRLDLRDDLFDIAALLGGLRQAKARWPDLHLAIFDYAQLVKGIRLKGDTREMEIASVSRLTRRAAMETGCAILLLAQINKSGEARESMSIEQDMTARWHLSSQDEEEQDPDADQDAPQERTLSIPRQRNGRSGIGFRLLFQGHLATVSELEEHQTN